MGIQLKIPYALHATPRKVVNAASRVKIQIAKTNPYKNGSLGQKRKMIKWSLCRELSAASKPQGLQDATHRHTYTDYVCFIYKKKLMRTSIYSFPLELWKLNVT